MKLVFGFILLFMAMNGATAAVAAASNTTKLAPIAANTTKPVAATAKAAAVGAATAAAPGQAPADPDAAAAAAADKEAQAAAAANVEVDLSSIPKLDVVGPMETVGGSTAVGSVAAETKGAKQSSANAVPLTDFSPVWPADKKANANQVLIDVVTDSPVDTIKTNQVPFIQSLAEALGVDTKQIYWYNLTSSELNIAYFLIDSQSPEAKKAVLASLANPDNTAKFYANAAAYTLNILNGPEVAPQELDLGTDVISTPDNYKAYNGDTGLITNNATAASSSARMVGEGSAFGFLSVMLSFAAAVGISLAVLA